MSAMPRTDIGGPPPPLTLRASLLVLLVGLVAAAIVTVVTGMTLAHRTPTYTAKAALVLLPRSSQDRDAEVKIGNVLDTGTPAKTAAAVFGAQPIEDAASRAAGGTVTMAAAVATTNPAEVDVTVTAPSAPAAEGAAQAAIDAATPVVDKVSGPYALTVIGSPAGSAVDKGPVVSTVLLFVFPGALLAAMLLALLVRQAILHRRAAQLVDS